MEPKYLLTAFVACLIFIQPQVLAQGMEVHFFWGNGCPHCADEEPFIDYLQEKYPDVVFEDYEVWYNESNAQLLTRMAAKWNVQPLGVPATFVCDYEPVMGYSDNETTGKKIEDLIVKCIEGGGNGNDTVDIPGFGKIDLSAISLPAFTVMIAGMDGFNPCAFFVLFFLLGMLIYAGSRKRMLLIGGIFIFFSAFIYFLFMTAWLNFFLFTGQILFITTVAGLVAIAASAVNIKDFFFFKKGASMMIPESKKSDLFKRMRKVLQEKSAASAVMATMFLAAAANAYELLCTLGFPMIYTKALTLSNLSIFEYYIYLVLYNVIYVIPLAIIVLVFTFTLGSRKLSEFHGRVLKLLSGSMMMLLGLMLVVSPESLSNVLVAGGILVAALLTTGVLGFFARPKKTNKPEIKERSEEDE
ncbi:MAG: hypothetical protein ABIH90_01050 [Candidatus Aenigmatarchaeota archaeon]